MARIWIKRQKTIESTSRDRATVSDAMSLGERTVAAPREEDGTRLLCRRGIRRLCNTTERIGKLHECHRSSRRSKSAVKVLKDSVSITPSVPPQWKRSHEN